MRARYNQIIAVWMAALSPCFAQSNGWTAHIWPASAHSPRTIAWTNNAGTTNEYYTFAKDAWAIEMSNAVAERCAVVGRVAPEISFYRYERTNYMIIRQAISNLVPYFLQPQGSESDPFGTYLASLIQTQATTAASVAFLGGGLQTMQPLDFAKYTPDSLVLACSLIPSFWSSNNPPERDVSSPGGAYYGWDYLRSMVRKMRYTTPTNYTLTFQTHGPVGFGNDCYIFYPDTNADNEYPQPEACSSSAGSFPANTNNAESLAVTSSRRAWDLAGFVWSADGSYFCQSLFGSAPQTYDCGTLEESRPVNVTFKIPKTQAATSLFCNALLYTRFVHGSVTQHNGTYSYSRYPSYTDALSCYGGVGELSATRTVNAFNDLIDSRTPYFSLFDDYAAVSGASNSMTFTVADFSADDSVSFASLQKVCESDNYPNTNDFQNAWEVPETAVYMDAIIACDWFVTNGFRYQ